MTDVSSRRPPGAAETALFVDLDGTLVASDLLWEALVRAVKQSPWIALLVPFWLLRGRAGLKHEISRRSAPDPAGLPYRQDVLAYVRERKDEGSRIVLATASHERWARDVATHLGLFDDVLSSDAARNLKGAHKLAAIEAYCQRHGYALWGYIGDSPADLAIWAAAGEVHVVEPSRSLLARIRRRGEPARIFGRRPGLLRAAFKLMRPHQWVKNVLLFVPLLLARQYTDVSKTFAAIVAFAAFSLCASSVYVLNDLLDVEADRLHPRKRKRPFAAGTLPLAFGPLMTGAIMTAAFALSLAFLPGSFAFVLLIYMLVTSAYSIVLKSKVLLDVFVLASLYTLRVFAGSVATGLDVSEWLLAFSIFIFTSLAFAKRYIEMARLQGEGKTTAMGRGYQVGDISLIESFGTTSGYLAVLVFALYVNNGLPSFYRHTWLLWLSCPLLMFWISRLWFLAKRGELNDDPVIFAVTDRMSLSIGVVIGVLVLLAAPLW